MGKQYIFSMILVVIISILSRVNCELQAGRKLISWHNFLLCYYELYFFIVTMRTIRYCYNFIVDECSSFSDGGGSVPENLKNLIPSWTLSLFQEDCITHDYCYTCVSL